MLMVGNLGKVGNQKENKFAGPLTSWRELRYLSFFKSENPFS